MEHLCTKISKIFVTYSKLNITVIKQSVTVVVIVVSVYEFFMISGNEQKILELSCRCNCGTPQEVHCPEV